MNKIDIFLISKSHATERTVVKIPNYTVYYAYLPDGNAHAGSAIIIKTKPYTMDKIQSCVVKVNALSWPSIIAAAHRDIPLQLKIYSILNYT